ncbi:nucleotidyltransferase domain-containing protein [Candidatus Woesearchaeota archaeon]|nr:nucleotidyltransferase domain-containing protein [Candidatus Woesearchaeota archaeon]
MEKAIIKGNGRKERDVFVFTPKQADYKDKALSYLSRALGKKVTIKAISEDLKLSYGSLHLTIHKLHEDKIINIEEIGNYKLISLNFKNMLAISELARVSIKISQGIISQNKKLKRLTGLTEALRGYKEILSIVLFGSQARQMQHEKSDIDLLVILGVNSKNNRNLINEIKVQITSFGTKEFLQIQPIIADYQIFKSMLKSKEEINVGKEILKDGIVLEGYENYWKIIGEILE